MPADLIAHMLRQLPPSGSMLRLLDLGGHCAGSFRALRQDLDICCASSLPAEESGLDAIVALDQPLAEEFLVAARNSLRPGGRLIIGWRRGQADAGQQLRLEAAGLTRILIESQGSALLLRGERPHLAQDTLERIRQVAGGDVVADPQSWPGRYIHLPVRQTPDRPPWALEPGDALRWQALTLAVGTERRLLAFSSLPRAVAFMQEAVLRGTISGVNKVGKFPRDAARDWPLQLLLNPDPARMDQGEPGTIDVDPAAAASPDE